MHGMPLATDSVQQADVPSRARRLSSLSSIDYEDAFIVEMGSVPERSAEEWARAILEGAPRARRAGLVAGWSALGLQLGSLRSYRFVLGWQVRQSAPGYVLLGAPGRFGLAGELLVECQEQRLLFCDFVQLTNPAARVMWAAMEPLHGRVVRQVLTEASRREQCHAKATRT